MKAKRFQRAPSHDPGRRQLVSVNDKSTLEKRSRFSRRTQRNFFVFSAVSFSHAERYSLDTFPHCAQPEVQHAQAVSLGIGIDHTGRIAIGTGCSGWQLGPSTTVASAWRLSALPASGWRPPVDSGTTAVHRGKCRLEVVSACLDESLNAQQRREQLESIHVRAHQKMEELVTPAQRRAFVACRQRHGERTNVEWFERPGGGCGARGGAASAPLPNESAPREDDQNNTAPPSKDAAPQSHQRSDSRAEERRSAPQGRILTTTQLSGECGCS